MSRIARIKSPGYIYHIMCRSISEVALFRDDDDKTYYLGLLKKYCVKFHCSILAYCLLDNHLHIHLDPQGFDISKYMHCVNLSYVIYYNKKYKRHGHVLQGRFESRVVSSDSYNLAVSAYIHNNPKDIEGYHNREYEYPFSSMGIYNGTRKDKLGLVNTGFILGLFNTGDKDKAVKSYTEFVTKQKDLATDKSITKCLSRFASNEYRDERNIIFRNYKPAEILTYITKKLGMRDIESIKLKSNRGTTNIRSFSAFILRSLCGYTYKDICKSIGNISLSATSRLCSNGYKLFAKREEYRSIFDEIVKMAVPA